MTSVLVGWPGGSLEATLKLAALLFIAYAIVLWISAVVWIYRDVRMRVSDPVSQTVAVFLVLFFNLPGLIVYLVLRPQETIADAYERSLEAEAILHELQGDPNACQSCRRPIEAEFKVCPYCKAVLREPCTNCGKWVRTNWLACPYCAVDRVVAPVRQTRPVGPATVPLPAQRPQRPPQTPPGRAEQRPPVAR